MPRSNREVDARGRSLRYLEKLRLLHAGVTVMLDDWSDGMGRHALAAAARRPPATSCWSVPSGMSILSATRDLAVALVDVTQHVARLTEAIATLLMPHELRDHPEAEPLVKSGAAIAFNNVTFGYPGGARRSSSGSACGCKPGQRVGLVGQSGGGKSTLFALLQRFYDVQTRAV